MGEYAEIAWKRSLSRGFYASRKDWNKERNPVEAFCPICGKGIRPVAGCTKKSLAAHMNAKHKGKTDG